jgi:hypothetical protein
MKRGELTASQREAARLMASGSYPTIKMVADAIGVSSVAVSNWAGSDLFKAHLANLQRAKDIENTEVSKRYLEMQEPARQVIEEIMTDGVKEENRLRAALHVAGVGGHTPIKRETYNNAIFSLKDIDEIAGRIDANVKKEHNNGKDDIEDAEVIE